MRIVLDIKDLAKYPFLKESQHFISDFASDLESFLSGNTGRMVIKRAGDCIRNSLLVHDENDTKTDSEIPPHIAIATYAVTRILVSCSGERALIDRLVTWQTRQFYENILEEDWDMKVFLAERVGIDITSPQVPVRDYVESVRRLREDHWRLVNRIVIHGLVTVSEEETDVFIRERLWNGIREQLPLRVPASICSLLEPILLQVHDLYQKKIMQEFGVVEESAYPPCIQGLLTALASGAHITHIGRFAATAFLHNIGMKNDTILELYGRAPDFNVEKTLYQVDHISGAGGFGTEYIAPGCSTMKTHSLCINPDSLCKSVIHPLSYYKQKKKLLKNQKKMPEKK